MLAQKTKILVTGGAGFIGSHQSEAPIENNEINTFGIKNSYYRLLVQDYIPTLTVLIKKTVIDEIGVCNSFYIVTGHF